MKATISYETNQSGRTFLLINGQPSFVSWASEADKPSIEVAKGKVLINGQPIGKNQLPSGTTGVMDNRHRNWRKRG